MKNFYLVMNAEKEGAERVREVIRRYLQERGASCFSSERLYVKGRRFTELCDVPPETECVITLGGDGTLIRAARDFAARRLPIVGINLGGLGYLTEMGHEGNVEKLLDALLENRYEIEERMMLKGTVYHNGRIKAENIALNDIVLNHMDDLRMLRLRIRVDDQILSEYSADGMIVATPTGSTAYNLAAGGPIAQPDSRLMILTPICPHMLNSRSVIFGADDRIIIELTEKNRASQAAVFDGDTYVQMANGDSIQIECSKMTTRVVKLNRRSFFEVLKQKLEPLETETYCR